VGYILLQSIFAPFLLLLRYLGRSNSQKNLVIQTAKIGDCLNSTPLLSALNNFDLVCEKSCLDIVTSFPGIDSIFLLNKYRKSGLSGKIRLALILFSNRYSMVYVLQPNALNVFLAEMAYPDYRFGINVEYKRNYINRHFCYRNRCINHGQHDLVLDTYLKMLPTLYLDRKKHYYGVKCPVKDNAKFIEKNIFYIGVSISAGNKMKSLPKKLTCELLKFIEQYQDITVIFFGVRGEEKYLKSVEDDGCLEKINYIDMIGKLSFGETAWFVEKINLYISSDTGLSYLADTLGVPLINFMGPCNYHEQRPLGDNVLIIKTKKLMPFSFIFDAPYHSVLSNDELYDIDDESMRSVKEFIKESYRSHLY